MLNLFNTFEEIAESDIDTAVFPMASVEPKGPHLPVGFDIMLAGRFSKDFCIGKAVYLLPVFPFSTAMETGGFRGTLTFSAMTARQVLEDITDSLYAGGFKKAVLVNIHGGNWVIKPTLIEINQRYRDFKIISTGDILGYRGQLPVERLHACESEASFIKAYYPDCFKADRVVDYSPKCPASAFDLVGIGGVSPKGVWGYPSKATAEKGRKDLEKKVSEAVAYIKKIF
jgi:creatinine amidohydrolase